MNCKKCKPENLSAYLDGMLDGDMMRRVAAHLRECPDCRRAYEGLSSTKSLLHSMPAPVVAAGSDFWAQTYRRARLEAREQPSRRRFGLPDLRAIGRRWTFAAATAGVATLSAALFLLSPVSINQPQTQVPKAAGPTLDLSGLARAHADYAAQQPLADDSRLSIILSDVAQADTLAGAASDDTLGADSDSRSSTGASTPEVAADAAGSLD